MVDAKYKPSPFILTLNFFFFGMLTHYLAINLPQLVPLFYTTILSHVSFTYSKLIGDH